MGMEKVEFFSGDMTSAEKLESIYSRVTMRLVPYLFICYIFSFLDRVNVGFAKLQMQKDLALSETVYGLGAGIFFIGYFVFEVPSNLLLEKFGPRRWIGRIMITWGIVSAATMFAHSEATFYLCRFMLGVMEAGFFPGIILYFTYWYPKNRRARITALFMAAVPAAGLIGGPISGWILDTFSGCLGLAGWKWLFLMEGIPSFVLGIVTLFYLDDGIGSAKWLKSDEKNLLDGCIKLDEEGKCRHCLKEGLLDWRVWLFGVIYFCYVAGLYGFSFWLPQMIKNTGINSALNIGFLTAIPNAVAVAGMIWAGRNSDRTLDRRFHTLACGVTAGVGLALSAAFQANTLISVLAATLGMAGIMACLAIFWAIPTAMLAGTAAAGGIALVNSMGNLGGFVSPYMMGLIKDITGGLAPGLYTLAVLMVFGAILVMIFAPRGQRAGA